MEGTNNAVVVKDFCDFENTRNVLSDERYQDVVDMNDAYLFDSDTVLLLTVVIDCSQSVQNAGAFPTYNDFMKSVKNIIVQNPEACANIKVCVIRYGQETEVVTRFTNMYEYEPDDQICHNMGTTDTAKALTKAFELTEKEMYYEGKILGKKMRGGIVFHITDGMPTSSKDEMMKAIKTYDDCVRSNGKRRIKIFSVTPDKDTADRLSYYSDHTFLTEDYYALTDAVNAVAVLASELSSLPLQVDPLTGETDIDMMQANNNNYEVGEGVIDIIPRKVMNIADMW